MFGSSFKYDGRTISFGFLGAKIKPVKDIRILHFLIIIAIITSCIMLRILSKDLKCLLIYTNGANI